jgi:hypothetical protein
MGKDIRNGLAIHSVDVFTGDCLQDISLCLDEFPDLLQVLDGKLQHTVHHTAIDP